VYEFLDEIERALGARLYQLALAGALAVPDIAAALEAQDGRSSRQGYERWFDAHVALELVTWSGPLTGASCYRFRCSLLHQGTVEDQKPPLKFRRLVFVDPAVNAVFHLNQCGDVLNLDLRLFCLAIVTAARRWLSAMSGTEPFRTNLEKCVRYRANGLPPAIIGVPVIG
jgi:hypothetical protein